MEVDLKSNSGKTTNELTRRYKYVITLCLYLCYFVYAMNLYITGPSILDLKRIYNVSMSSISDINTARSFAYTFGCLNGFLFQYINRQLGVAVLLLIVSITMALTPHLKSMTLLLVNIAFNGYASGGIESAADVWILEMWQHECGPFVQALHFTFGAGSIMTPLVVQPFLSEETINDTDSSSNTTTITTATPVDSEFHSRVYIPYLGGAIAIALAACVIGGLYFYKKYEPPSNRLEETLNYTKDQTTWKKVLFTFRTQIWPSKYMFFLIIMSAIFMSVFLGMEWAQFLYFPSFAYYSTLRVSERRAATISSGLAIAFTIGRGLAIPIALKLRPHQMLYGSLCIISIANALFLFFANNSELVMWIGNVIYGLGFSSVYACIYALLEEQTMVSNLHGAIFIFMSGLTTAIYPKILGTYIEKMPLILVYLCIFSTVACFVILISMRIAIRSRNRSLNIYNVK